MTAPTPDQMRALEQDAHDALQEAIDNGGRLRMTIPADVHKDTDLRVAAALAALRAAADSVEQWIRVAVKLSDRIDKAPHGRLCGSFSWNSNGTGWDHNPENCNCWKADAL